MEGIGVVSRPIGVGAQAASDATFSKPGRYHLKLTFEDGSDKQLFNATGGAPYTSEMAVEVIGRAREEDTPGDTIEVSLPGVPEEPPSTPLLAGVGGALAVVGFGAGALVLWRRRA